MRRTGEAVGRWWQRGLVLDQVVLMPVRKFQMHPRPGKVTRRAKVLSLGSRSLEVRIRDVERDEAVGHGRTGGDSFWMR